MTRIITAAEAGALREAATPGPWRPINGRDDPDPAWGSFPVVVGAANDTELAVVRGVLGDDHRLMAAAPDLAATVEHLHAQLAQAIAERDEARRVLLALADGCDDAHGVADDQIAAIGGALIEATGAASLLACGAALRRLAGGES